jgi:hypothetical protein
MRDISQEIFDSIISRLYREVTLPNGITSSISLNLQKNYNSSHSLETHIISLKSIVGLNSKEAVDKIDQIVNEIKLGV